MKEGLIHLYHGEGKGKTTAAIGIAVRAAGNGLKVLFVQFMKGNETGELNVLGRVSGVTVFRSNKNLGFVSKMSEEEKQQLTDIHNEILGKVILVAEEYDMIVLDEVTYPCSYELINVDLLRQFIEKKPPQTELILTGRNPVQFMIDKADYITNMTCEKHPYESGITARKGIEF